MRAALQRRDDELRQALDVCKQVAVCIAKIVQLQSEIQRVEGAAAAAMASGLTGAFGELRGSALAKALDIQTNLIQIAEALQKIL